jgi:formylglycine-generating enzyme required for sulfatase activity
MNQLPRQKLCEIISKYGRSVCDDPRKCEGLLRDFCGEYKGEINVLVGALKERVAADLLTSQTNVPHEVILARLTKRLIDDLFLAEDAARWAVESWALALGVISSNSHTKIDREREAPAEPYQRVRQESHPPGKNEIIGKDGAPMALIPAGEFQMGSNERDNEKPVHTVYLDAFYIDKYEVTNAQYRKFMDATEYKAPACWDDSKFNAPGHPVVSVSWDDAVAYAKWAGKRLPTEAQWEKAARGGLVGKKYPWGDELTHDYANYSGTGGRDKWEYTSPVGSFPPNGYGLYDMAGNVWEWCADWYDKDYYKNSPKQNPKGPDSGNIRVLRGGSWGTGDGYFLRAACRFDLEASVRYYYVGFRCSAQD